MADFLQAALLYASWGWPVFPIHSVSLGVCSCRKGATCGRNAGKHPRIKGGFKAASTDPEQIRAWWGKWPDANIGIATGAVCVLDVDGESGLRELQALVAQHGGLPSTLVARTGSGVHLYWQAVEGARSSAKGNLHVRAAGGYVVAPPSMHRSGRRYEWVRLEAPAVAPEWLAEWMGVGGTRAAAVDPFVQMGPKPAYLSSAGGSRALVPVDQGLDWSAHFEARIRSALVAIPADEYHTWFLVGMCLHTLEMGHGWETPEGSLPLKIFIEWSETSKAFVSDVDCAQKWLSFGKRTGSTRTVTIGSLFHLAQEHGWTGVVTPLSAGVTHGHVNGSAGPANFFQQASAVNSGKAIVFPDTDKAGRPKATADNTRHAVEGLGICCKKDTFHGKVLVAGQPVQQWTGDLCDDAVLVIREMVKRQFGFEPESGTVQDACVQLALRHQFNPVLDYLEGLEWDGVPRVDEWALTYLGAPDTVLNRAVGRLMLIAAVRRARAPGCKFDHIIVLEGPEGAGKSSAVRILAGDENFSDQSILAVSDREQQEAHRGVWIHELAELAGLRRTDSERLKAFASRTEDRARPAYGRLRVDLKRQGIFVATTNDKQYLKSDTGNRRFWPLVTGVIDLAGLRRDRDQLWAEAAMCEARGDSISLDRSLWGVAADEQARRMSDPDIWDERLTEWLADPKHLAEDGTISVREVLLGCLVMQESHIDRNAQMRVAHSLQRLGWERFQIRNGTIRCWRYKK